LEEIEDSDLIVHLVDASHPDHHAQIEAVRSILADLGYEEIPRLLVFNKADLCDETDLNERLGRSDGLAISALRMSGIERMLERIDFALPPDVRATQPSIH
jgi:GTP-binding protein HflX